RRDALAAREQVRVQTELDEVAGLGVPGELGVEHLVAVAAQRGTGHGYLFEEVRKAAPGAVGKRGLVDHVDASAHRGDRLLDRVSVADEPVYHRRNHRDIQSLSY